MNICSVNVWVTQTHQQTNKANQLQTSKSNIHL
jgi:hypothetical protein